jgi:hypothetical protein
MRMGLALSERRWKVYSSLVLQRLHYIFLFLRITGFGCRWMGGAKVGPAGDGEKWELPVMESWILDLPGELVLPWI